MNTPLASTNYRTEQEAFWAGSFGDSPVGTPTIGRIGLTGPS